MSTKGTVLVVPLKMAQKPVAMDSCFSLISPHKHGIASSHGLRIVQ